MRAGDKPDVLSVGRVVTEGGRYLYCVADNGECVSLGGIGLDNREVYAIPYEGICAVVHRCRAQPYQTDDRMVIEAWALAHQRVVDAAWELWSTVVPLTFDTIIRSGEGNSADRRVKEWLKQEHKGLTRKLDRVRAKAEYGVQVLWDPKVAIQSLTEASSEIGKLNVEIKARPRGLAYMYRQRLENLIRHELEAKADECFRELYDRIKEHTDDIRVEKTRKSEEGGLQMILSLSCLVHGDRYLELGEELDQINRREGFSVRYTGPWPPYSFVQGG